MVFVSLAMSSAAAQERSPETLSPKNAAWDMERAFEELERLQAEVAVLHRLGEAQAALLAWNRERADSGTGPVTLAAHLCGEEGLAPWCRALPATFGAGAAEAADDANEKDGGR